MFQEMFVTDGFDAPINSIRADSKNGIGKKQLSSTRSLSNLMKLGNALTRNSRSSRLYRVPAPKNKATGASTDASFLPSHVIRILARPNPIACSRGLEKLSLRTIVGALVTMVRTFPSPDSKLE